MTRMWTPGGAAERFDRLVDPLDERPPSSSESRELLDLVDAIRDLPEVSPRPAYAADLRSRLLVEADRLAAARTTSPAPAAAATAEERLRLRPRSEGSRRRRLTVVAGTLTALGVGAGVGVAAQTALPGESLYGVKRALETARTQVTASDTERGGLLLGNASDRLAETLAVLDSDDVAGTAQLSATLDSFSEEASAASTLLLDEYDRTGDRALVEQLRTFTASSARDLGAMQPDMPESGLASWQRASDTVSAIDTDALTACPVCSADLSSTSLSLPVTPDFGGSGTTSQGRDRSGAGRGTDADPRGEGADPRREGRDRPDRAGPGEDRGSDSDTSSPGGSEPEPPTTPGTPSPRLPAPDSDRGGLGGGLGGAAGDLTDGVRSGLLGGSATGGSGRGNGDEGPRRGGSNGSGSNGGGSNGGGSRLDLGGLDDLIP